jgi:hypothetical protein
MTRNITLIFIIIAVSTIAFFLGYRYGFRDTYNQTPATIDFSQNEFGTLNSLTKVKIKAVLGPQNTTDTEDYSRGFVLIKNNQNSTDLRISLKNIPANIQISEDKKNNISAQKVSFPTNLRIETANTNPITKSLNFSPLSNLTLDPMVNNSYTGELNLNVDANNKQFNDANFLFFFDANNSTQNLYQIDLKDYPNIDQAKKRPFLWVYLQ